VRARRVRGMRSWTITYPLPDDPDSLLPLGPATAVPQLLSSATLITEPTPYVLVTFAGEDPRESPLTNALLESARRAIARAAGIRLTDTVPKLALVSRSMTSGFDLQFCTRMFPPDAVAADAHHSTCWHSGVATGGVLALALAAADARTVPGAVLPQGCERTVRVATPAGPRVLEYVTGPDGRPAVRVDIGRVTVEG
jgi:hypothetical protein